MRYYKNEDFFIISTDMDAQISAREICAIGFNLLVKLEHKVSTRTCACLELEHKFYAIFPKVVGPIDSNVISFLIERLETEGIDFEKEDVEIENLQVDTVGGSMPGFPTFEDFLRECFGISVDGEEDTIEESMETEETETGRELLFCKGCPSVEFALALAKRLKLEDFTVLECRKRVFLLTEQLEIDKAKFHQFRMAKRQEAFLKEHGVVYYEHCNYKELESLSFLDTISAE